MRYMAAGFAVALALGWHAPAWAQDCTTTCDEYDNGTCVIERHTCTFEPPKPSYGAIAYGRKSGAYGYSHGWGDQAKAESVAMENCAQHGSDCEVMVWFDRKCGAVAARSDSTIAYWGLGDGAGAANSQAMSQCTKDGGRGCEVKVSHCSR
jgi:Domain of unknown function (DUF4189)